MSEENKEHKPTYIIKRIKKTHAGHHGGSWKIAYADFVTAMMAFFLLMWLLSMMNKYQLEGISNYFKKPLKEAFAKNPGDSPKKTKIIPNELKTLEKIDSKTQHRMNMVTNMKDFDKMNAIKKELENKLNSDPQMSQFKNQLNFIVTSDGLKIQLKDLQNQSMFTTGKADFQEHAEKILSWLSGQLNTFPNHVVVIGHTDTAPYAGETKDYTNWELSADRANATRRSLVKYGMDDKKIMRVMGAGDTQLLDKQNGLDPANRRIEIIVLTDKAAEKMKNE